MIKIRGLKKKMKSIALLEAILSPEWEDRYYSYNTHWDNGEEMASMRDGEGNRWFLWIKGLLAAISVHTTTAGSAKNIKQILKLIPAAYDTFIKEPAFLIQESSAILYLEAGEWKYLGIKDDSITAELAVLEWDAADYSAWAKTYYETSLDIELVKKVMEGHFSLEIAQHLNPHINLESLEEDLQEIGVP